MGNPRLDRIFIPSGIRNDDASRRDFQKMLARQLGFELEWPRVTAPS